MLKLFAPEAIVGAVFASAAVNTLANLILLVEVSDYLRIHLHRIC